MTTTCRLALAIGAEGSNPGPRTVALSGKQMSYVYFVIPG